MSLTPLVKDDLIDLQSTAYAAQSQTDPVRDGENEPLGDIWGANALLGTQVDANLQITDAKARLATSVGDDLDSGFEIFGVQRVQAQPSGVTLSISLQSPASIDTPVQVGQTFQTSTGLPFVVIADPTQPSYTGLGYIIPANSSAAVSVSAVCSIPGAIGNVAANTITQPTSGLGQPSGGSYVVTNPTPASGGSEKEDDPTYIQRFIDDFRSGRYGTNLGILVAIEKAATGLTYQLYEGKNPDGSAHAGFFTVFVNVLGATTSTPQAIINAVTLQIALIKACGINYTVVAPALTVVPAAAQLVIDPNYASADVLAAAATAYSAYTNGIGLDPSGSSTLLSYAKVSAVLVTVPGVKNVLNFTLNGGTADIVAAVGHQFVAGTTTFTAA